MPETVPLSPPGQGIFFPQAMEATFGPLVLLLALSLEREKRRKCEGCGKRRVCIYIALGDAYTSPHLCSACTYRK